MRKLFFAFSISAGLLFAQTAISDMLRADHPNEYVVVKGDTLWDISARFLEKPWLWPEIWNKNPQVKNPNLIYPGDIIRLTYVNGKPVLTINEMPNTNQVPIGAIDINIYNRPFLQDLRVVTSFKDLPYVLGVDEGQTRAVQGDAVYVHSLKGVAIGETVEFFRPTRNFARTYHGNKQISAASQLDSRGDRLVVDGQEYWDGISTLGNSRNYIGTEMRRVATGRVTEIKGDLTRVFILDATREIRVGDRVTPNSRESYDPYYFPSKGPLIEKESRIMAITAEAEHAGARSVVTIPLGSNQGIRNGNTYEVWSQGQKVPDRIEHREEIAAKWDTVTMIQENIGYVMVYRTFDNVSYAIVMKATKPIAIGDYLHNPQ
jgi:hypothetical protein